MSFVARLRPVRLPRELVALAIRGHAVRQASALASRPSLALPHQTLRHARQLYQSFVCREEASRIDGEEEKATEFVQLDGTINRTLLETIGKDMRLTTMTPVQSATIHEALKGVDVLAQAKTGTGKTLGFLLPVVQNILNADNSLLKRSFSRHNSPYGRNFRMARADTDTYALIVSPTRELAEQIAEVARQLTQRTGIKVQTAVGGTAKSMHMRKIKTEGCHLLVGTPGRINDILSDDIGGIGVPKLKTLVFDEADRLLDQGFEQEIEAIKEMLPTTDRQNLMYSATIDGKVQSLARSLMKPDMHYVHTVSEDDVPTHERVQQNLVVTTGSENQLLALFELLKMAEANPTDGRPFKAIVYFNSSAEVQWATDIAFRLKRSRRRDLMPTNLRIDFITARRTQASRSQAADTFRAAKSAILFSSDVTARGMDFPNVTHVIQVGLPSNRDTYIHRLGRTARAGAEGQGWILVPKNAGAKLLPALLKGIPMERRTEELESAQVDLSEYDPAVVKEPGSQEPFAVQLNAAIIELAQENGQREMQEQLRSQGGALAQHVDADGVRESLYRMSEIQFGMTWDQDVFPFLKKASSRTRPRRDVGRGSLRGGGRDRRGGYGGGGYGGSGGYGGGGAPRRQSARDQRYDYRTERDSDRRFYR